MAQGARHKEMKNAKSKGVSERMRDPFFDPRQGLGGARTPPQDPHRPDVGDSTLSSGLRQAAAGAIGAPMGGGEEDGEDADNVLFPQQKEATAKEEKKKKRWW